LRRIFIWSGVGLGLVAGAIVIKTLVKN